MELTETKDIEYLLDLKIQKKIETLFRQQLPCIDKLKQDNETQKFNIQSLNKRVKELEKEVELLKIGQRRRFKKTVKELLRNLRPQKSWLEYIQEWRDGITYLSLEEIFTASNFLDTFLEELKNIKPSIISLKDNVQIPDTLCPIINVKNENKSELYIWDNDLEEWTIIQYSHLRKLITIYIYQIRELWLQWQEQNIAKMSDYTICEKYNNYISKPVSILYNEKYKNRMIQTILHIASNIPLQS